MAATYELKNIRKVTFRTEDHAVTDSYNPDTREYIVKLLEGRAEKQWRLIQGNPREYREQHMLASFNKSEIARYAKKVVSVEASADHLTYRVRGISPGSSNGTLAFCVATSAFDANTVTYNTEPNAAEIGYSFIRYMSANSEQIFYGNLSLQASEPYHTTTSLKQLLNNGICLKMTNGSSPLTSGASNWLDRIYIQAALDMQVTVADIALLPHNCTPSSNAYVNPAENLEVSWMITPYGEYFAEAPAQAFFTLEYYTKNQGINSATRTITGGAEQKAVIPYTMLQDIEYLYWRVKVVSDDGIEGAYTSWQQATTIPKTGKPVAVSPSGSYVSKGETVTFVWEHSSYSGAAQSRVQFRFQNVEGNHADTAAVVTAGRQYSMQLPDMMFEAAGIAYWCVRTMDTSGTWSSFSDYRELYIAMAPDTPVISTVEAGTARPTVYWQTDTQAAFRMRVYSLSGETVYDSGVANSAERQHKMTDYLPDGGYTIGVIAWNEYGRESQEGKRLITVRAQPVLDKPEFVCASLQGGVRIQVMKSTAAALFLIRNGVPVARLTGNTYLDYTCHDDSRYTIRAFSAGGTSFKDSDPVWGRPYIRHALLSCAECPEEWIRLVVRRDELPGHEESITFEASVRHFQGRKLPVVEFSPYEERTHSHTFSLVKRKDIEKLKNILKRKKPLLWRDRYEKYFCIASGISVSKSRFSWDFTLTLQEVDYKEAVDYD